MLSTDNYFVIRLHNILILVTIQGAYRTLKVVFSDFTGPFMCSSSGPFMSIMVQVAH